MSFFDGLLTNKPAYELFRTEPSESPYPESHSTKTFIGKQQKFHHALTFLRLIAAKKMHNAHIKKVIIANFEIRQKKQLTTKKFQ